MADNWESVRIEAIVAKMVAVHTPDSPDKFSVRWPSLFLPADLVLAISLAFHELATNAIKYGALSSDAGYVALEWRLAETNETILENSWTEIGGPPVIAPQKTGFGSRLLHHVFPGHLRPNINIEYAETGINFLISFIFVQP